ncbi:MAG: hypothetical protein PHV33_15000, partial [Elusimicrobiales bacterium]|nr:hypothetical protein [Elusimicrobiales bacterium]
MLGSLWAVSEIILGSFLHNARVPFKGVLLTGIGVAVLVAGRRLWPERGLLWRAGLICAAMKSVSPSAVLLNPMIAIFMEGLLAEAGVFLLGGGPAGCLLGGGLAMTWCFVHTVGSKLIYYGPDVVKAYISGVERLFGSAAAGPGLAWRMLAALAAAHFLAGLAAAGLGLRAAASGARVVCRPVSIALPRGRRAGPRRAHSIRLL